MECIGIAMLVMAVATIATHLGLPQAIAEVVGKICECHKCLSFWSTFIILTVATGNIVVAALLSIIAAYLSGWFALVLIILNKLYDKLWERLNKK